MRISFQAPRFDADGNKIENARFITVELNGIVIHRNVEVTGPTRAHYVDGESPKGPLVIQGDHGPVAFRNMKYRSFSDQAFTIKQLRYQVVRQPRNEFSTWDAVALDDSGEEERITWEVVKSSNNFSLRYQGVVELPQTGKYKLSFTSGGPASLKWNGEELFPRAYWTRSKFVELAAGQYPFEIEYSKTEPWLQGRLALEIEGENFRPVALNYPSSNIVSAPVDPIFVRSENEARHLRSFVDFKMPQMEAAKRFTNTINIGDPSQTHYTYDLKQGSLIQAWKGNFLNTTPMWNNRGNGVSVPMGAVLQFTANPQVRQQNGASLTDRFSDGTYHYKSYSVDENNRPTFHYNAYGVQVADQILPQQDRKGIKRQVQFSSAGNGKVVYCLAESDTIEKIEKQLYLVGDGQYYIQSNDNLTIQTLPDNRKALLFTVDGASELSYQIIW